MQTGRSLSKSERAEEAFVWPMVKRLPTYGKLALALLKEPAIPQRHKIWLYSVVLYEVSPPHLLIAAVPVLGQIDSIALFLIGLRQILRHCPPVVAARHLERLSLTRTQMAEDWAVLRVVARHLFGGNGRGAGAKLRFAGRVARGFARRRARRLTAADL